MLPRLMMQALRRSHAAAASRLPADARIEHDVAYGPEPAQCLDVYRPPGTPAGPLVMLVHGGGWAIGDKAGGAVIGHKIAHWLSKGYAVVSINYRLLPLADPIEQAGDVARALAFVQANAVAWSVDVSRLVVVGHSTGAHLVALLAADAELAASRNVLPWLATVLLDSAALDVVETMTRPHMPLHDRAFGADPAYWQDASPLHRLRKRPAPLLLVHSAGRPEAGSQARRFAAAVAVLGGRADVLSVALSHAEINAQLGHDPVYTAAVDDFFVSVGLP